MCRGIGMGCAWDDGHYLQRSRKGSQALETEEGMTLRFKLPPRDVPPVTAARHMGMTLEAFHAALPMLLGRGFPPPDETTGNFDVVAIDTWCNTRNPQLFPPEVFSKDRLTPLATARDAKDVVSERVARLRGG